MSRNQRWLVLGRGTFLALAISILAGCAAEGPVKPAGLEQKIKAARTRVDHQAIAEVYEQQAVGDRAAAERHRGSARAYERGRWKNKTRAAHCENLAHIYQQAAEENLALARAHRQLASEIKDRSAMRLTNGGPDCGCRAGALTRRTGNQRFFVIDAGCPLE